MAVQGKAQVKVEVVVGVELELQLYLILKFKYLFGGWWLMGSNGNNKKYLALKHLRKKVFGAYLRRVVKIESVTAEIWTNVAWANVDKCQMSL